MASKATSPEALLVRHTTRTNAAWEQTSEDTSPMQRFLAEDGRDQPWHNLSPVITSHVTSNPSSTVRSSSTTAATNGSTSKDTEACSNHSASPPSRGQTEGDRHDGRQVKLSIVHDLKCIGQVFADDKRLT